MEAFSAALAATGQPDRSLGVCGSPSSDPDSLAGTAFRRL